MRTLILALLAPLGGMLIACQTSASGSEPVVLRDADNGKQMTVAADQIVSIHLHSHRDGGYVWSVVDDGGLGKAEHLQDKADQKGFGNSGVDVFEFKTTGAAEGVHVIKLIDKRSFGNDPGTPYTVKIKL